MFGFFGEEDEKNGWVGRWRRKKVVGMNCAGATLSLGFRRGERCSSFFFLKLSKA